MWVFQDGGVKHPTHNMTYFRCPGGWILTDGNGVDIKSMITEHFRYLKMEESLTYISCISAICKAHIREHPHPKWRCKKGSVPAFRVSGTFDDRRNLKMICRTKIKLPSISPAKRTKKCEFRFANRLILP